MRGTVARFWAKVEKSDSCWLWTGSRVNSGYGSLTVNHRARTVHRLSWEIHNGAIPDGMHVCHRCDVRTCVRPDHLFLGTRADNMRDMHAKGRGNKSVGDRQRIKTHCPRGHEYAEENTWRDAKGYRQCRTRHREKERTRKRLMRASA